MSAHLTPEQLEAPGAAEGSHLEGCAQCRDGVRLAAGRQKLLKGVKPYTLADVAFSRVEARLMEHVRENPPGPRWSLGRLLAIGALAAVAALFAITTYHPIFPAKPAEVAVAVVDYEPMTVLQASHVTGVKAGEVLARGKELDASGGRVVLATADGVALWLSAVDAKVTLGPPNVTARLISGRLEVDATRRGPWVVVTNNTWVKATDAQFEVAPDQVTVSRGSVLISDSATFANARQLNAPAVLRLRDGTVSSAVGTRPPRRTVAPPWARLELPLDAAEVDLDGQSVGPGPLSLLSSPGRHHLRALVGDQWRESDVDLALNAPGLVTLPERAPAAPLAVPSGPPVEADPAAIAAAVKAQLPKLRVCHEKWLKVNEAARGKVMMTVTVSPKGRVTRAAFSADEGVPETVNECLGRAVRAMKLPSSSEEVELEIPLMLGGQ